MAITVMGGLLFSTPLTLILIPVVYELVDREGYGFATAPAPAAAGMERAGEWGGAERGPA